MSSPSLYFESEPLREGVVSGCWWRAINLPPPPPRDKELGRLSRRSPWESFPASKNKVLPLLFYVTAADARSASPMLVSCSVRLFEPLYTECLHAEWPNFRRPAVATAARRRRTPRLRPAADQHAHGTALTSRRRRGRLAAIDGERLAAPRPSAHRALRAALDRS